MDMDFLGLWKTLSVSVKDRTRIEAAMHDIEEQVHNNVHHRIESLTSMENYHDELKTKIRNDCVRLAKQYSIDRIVYRQAGCTMEISYKEYLENTPQGRDAVSGIVALLKNNPDQITIFVNVFIRKTVLVEVPSSCTVQDLKDKLLTIVGIPPIKQVIYFQGQELMNDRTTVADYRILHKSNLYLYLRLTPLMNT